MNIKFDKDLIDSAVWITWEYQPRNISMAKNLGIKLHQFTSQKSRIIKYFFLIYKTIPVLLNRKVGIVFVQNPSIVLAALSICIAKPMKKMVIIDAHNAGLFPLEGKYRTLNFACKWLFSRATLTLVTNSQLANYVDSNGGKAEIIPDPLPRILQKSSVKPKDHFFLICSWADDEPFHEVIQAFAKMPNQILKISGNYQKKLSSSYIKELPSNIVLCGFMSRAQYEETLASANAVIDLTNREMCVLCGIYEAIAADVPVIASKTNAIYEVFGDDILYTENDIESIEHTIKTFNVHDPKHTFRCNQAKSNALARESSYPKIILDRLHKII